MKNNEANITIGSVNILTAAAMHTGTMEALWLLNDVAPPKRKLQEDVTDL